jgi:hypothetical protein
MNNHEEQQAPAASSVHPTTHLQFFKSPILDSQELETNKAPYVNDASGRTDRKSEWEKSNDQKRA